MTRKTVTREDLTEAVHRTIGLSLGEARTLVSQVLQTIASTLERGETVKLSSFGSFVVRQKGERLGRNPTTLEPAAILGFYLLARAHAREKTLRKLARAHAREKTLRNFERVPSGLESAVHQVFGPHSRHIRN